MSPVRSVLVYCLFLAIAPSALAADGVDDLAGIAVQKDGKVVLVGETNANGTIDIAVARLRKDGSLDPKFGTAGKVVLDLGGTDEGLAVALDKRRRIVLGASTNEGGTGFDFVVLRLNRDGSLDDTFGTDGMTRTDMGGQNDAALSMAIDRKGRILLFGFVNPGADFQWGLARFTKDGVLDTTFGAGGKVYADFGSGVDFGYVVVVDRRGAITVAGINGDDNFTVARYDDVGTLDPDFGTGGFATADFGGMDRAYSVSLGKKRTVVATGSAEGGSAFAAARFDRDGALDPTFGGDGKVTIPSVPGDARASAVDSKGRLYLAGSSGGFAVARLLRDGALDQKFGTGGTFTANPTGTEVARRLTLGKRQSVFVGGRSTLTGDADMTIIQLDKKGVPVRRFNGGEILRIDF